MIYEPSITAAVIFFIFIGITVGLSVYLGKQAKSSEGYFTAHGQIPWFVNGIAFAGDYLSAASFLGICGMIAFYGYDGFLYSIGYLAGWIVALFVVAEPMKRLGKFTFADALDAKFNSRGIKFVAGISTLAVSIFYLIPQMVGAGVLIQPLFGLPHWAGVVLVGAVVIVIVVTAGMVSTTYVQFVKGTLLVIFTAVLTIMILARGFTVESGGIDGHTFVSHGPFNKAELSDRLAEIAKNNDATIVQATGDWADAPFVRMRDNKTSVVSTWSLDANDDQITIHEAQTTKTVDGKEFVNGRPKGIKKGGNQLHPTGHVSKLPDGKKETGPLGFVSFFSTLQKSEVVLWDKKTITENNGEQNELKTTVYFQKPTPGDKILRPGEHPKFKGIRGEAFINKLNFLSLMLALFCGTASLPHILIRYYTVKDAASARRSTIVGIAAIGFFYVLTLYLGLGAMTSGAMDPTNSNMAAPLLARSMSETLFAIISAIAFTTVLGTVSGLILASSGAVAHDLMSSAFNIKMTDHEKVRAAKITSVVVGVVAIGLGILFQEMNVSYLVGWAFSVAASANLPSLIMILFWKRVTKQGVIAAIVVGMTSSLGWILLSADTFTKVYGLSGDLAIMPFSQPGIVTIPLGFLTLIVVSLATAKNGQAGPSAESVA